MFHTSFGTTDVEIFIWNVRWNSASKGFPLGYAEEFCLCLKDYENMLLIAVL